MGHDELTGGGAGKTELVKSWAFGVVIKYRGAGSVHDLSGKRKANRGLTIRLKVIARGRRQGPWARSKLYMWLMMVEGLMKTGSHIVGGEDTDVLSLHIGNGKGKGGGCDWGGGKGLSYRQARECEKRGVRG